MSSLQNDSLCADFGMKTPVELDVTSPDGTRQRHTFAQPHVVLGSDERATLCLADAAVSRRHAYLQVLGGRIFVVDLESRTGLTLDGIPVRSGWFDPGQRLVLGSYRLDNAGPSFLPGSLVHVR